MYVVWALSFDKDCHDQLVAAGFVDLLESFPTDHAGVKKGIEGALWNLKPGKRPELSSAPKAGQPGHVMISYSWGQKERMRELAHHLKEAGLPIWIDVEEMEGSILEKMAQAVENSDVMVIGVSASYHDSQACHMEAEYGHRLKKSMIFVMAEEGYNARGWLGLMLGENLWYSPWKNPAGYEATVAEIVKIAKKSVLSSTQTVGAESSQVTARSHTSLETKPYYSDVEIPVCDESLLDDMLTPEKVVSWTVRDVCRWLKMKKLDPLLQPFVWHRMTGLALMNIHRNPNAAKHLLKSGGVEHLGDYLEFMEHLSQLFSPPSLPPPTPGKGHLP